MTEEHVAADGRRRADVHWSVADARGSRELSDASRQKCLCRRAQLGSERDIEDGTRRDMAHLIAALGSPVSHHVGLGSNDTAKLEIGCAIVTMATDEAAP